MRSSTAQKRLTQKVQPLPWDDAFGIRNLVSIFGIDCWNPEFGLSFSQVSGVILALQYHLPFIAQGGY